MVRAKYHRHARVAYGRDKDTTHAAGRIDTHELT